MPPARPRASECERIQILVSNRQDGPLEPAAARDVAEHLRACGECRGFARRIDELIGLLAEARGRHLPSPAFTERTVGKLLATPPPAAGSQGPSGAAGRGDTSPPEAG